MGKYKNGSLKGNGSFVVGTGGKITYTGTSSKDNNQVVAFDGKVGQYKAVDLSEMLDQQNYEFAESIVDRKEPDRRKNGQDLESGDLWFEIDEDYTPSVYHFGKWNAFSPIPVGTILTTVNPVLPAGYLYCDGEEVPNGRKYDKLRRILEEFGDGDTPNLSQEYPKFHIIKY